MDDQVVCSGCGQPIDIQPCPLCGATAATVGRTLQGTQGQSGSIVAEVHRAASADIGAVYASSNERTTSAGEFTPGEPQYWMEGQAPQNESNSLHVSGILVSRMNRDGCTWDSPRIENGPEQGVDCVATDTKGEKPGLRIQVTAAATDAKHYFEPLARGQMVDGPETDDAQAAKDLREAIEHKATRSTPQIVLALDATATFVGHALPAVAMQFHRQYGRWASQQGWQAIWLVGPTEDLTCRLDVEAP